MLTPRLDVPIREFPSVGLFGVINLMSEKPGTLRFAGSSDEALRFADEYRESGFLGVDIGAQSSHYAVREVPVIEQLGLLVPVIEALSKEGHLVSIETGSTVILRAALQAGAEMVNISGGLDDPVFASTLVEFQPHCIVPFTPRKSTRDVTNLDLKKDFEDQLLAGVASGIQGLRLIGVNSLIADGGVGYSFPIDYGSFIHYQVRAIRLSREIEQAAGAPVLVAVPRLDTPYLTAAFAALSIESGARYLRCHDPEMGSIAELLWQRED